LLKRNKPSPTPGTAYFFFLCYNHFGEVNQACFKGVGTVVETNTPKSFQFHQKNIPFAFQFYDWDAEEQSA